MQGEKKYREHVAQLLCRLAEQIRTSLGVTFFGFLRPLERES